MTGVRIENLTVRRGPRTVVRGVSLGFEPGQLVGLIGPNGAGKTTLLRATLGLLPHDGTSTLAILSPRDRARTAAWLPQTRDIAWPVDVATLVALGRTPYLAAGRKLSDADRAAIDGAIKRMDLSSLSHRPATELSGGEAARALIARVLAQDTPVIFADEPTAGLDPSHQIAAMTTFRNLAREGKTVVVSLHDLAMASRFCDRLVLLDHGAIAADGGPEDVLDAARMRDVFSIGGHWSETPQGRFFQPIEILQE